LSKELQHIWWSPGTAPTAYPIHAGPFSAATIDWKSRSRLAVTARVSSFALASRGCCPQH